MVMMNNNLKIFIKVAEKNSITKAAEELYISQPAVSKGIKNLEDELAVKLFVRDKKKGLILTDIGKTVLKFAHQMEYSENLIYQNAYMENHLLSGKLRIGTAPILISCVLAEIIAQYKSKYPKIEIELIEGSAADIKNGVENHKLDFGITYSPFDNFESKILFLDKMVAVSSKSLSVGYVDLSQYSGSLIFCYRSKETILNNISKDFNCDFTHCMTVQNPESVIRLAEFGNGIGIISELVLSAYNNNLKKYPIYPYFETKIGIIASSFSALSPAALKFVEMLEEKAGLKSL